MQLGFARTFGAALVCAHVDPGRYVIEERPDGTVVSLPLDPELPEPQATPTSTRHWWHRFGRRSPTVLVQLSFRELAGDVAYALTRLADILGR